EPHPADEEPPRPCAEPERNRQREPGVNPRPREQLESERAQESNDGKSSVCQFVGKRRSERPAGLGGISEEKRAREIRPEAEEREQHEGRRRWLGVLAGEVLDRRYGDTHGDQGDHGQDGRRRNVLATVVPLPGRDEEHAEDADVGEKMTGIRGEKERVAARRADQLDCRRYHGYYQCDEDRAGRDWK